MQHLHRAAVALLASFSLVGCASAETAPPPASPTPAAQAPAAQATAFHQELRKLEHRFDAHIGVYAVDTATGREITHHADERFAYASTHKALTAAAVLQQNTIDELNRRITYDRGDLLSYAPITKKHVDTGMTLRAVIDAAIRYSDNTAANLLFREIGGPGGLSAALRGIGDTTTHVDRIEPALNRTGPGDIRDTSTPRALAESLRKFTVGDVLTEEKRAFLNEMLRTNAVTDDLVRAGVPEGWQVGDKSGAADYGTRNDIAVIRPPHRAPIMLAVLSERQTKDADHDDALIAEATRVAIDALR
ncbi:beta-lactamase class A [Saccharopolyspora lacisalsi]|uniref:Beta-lactamase n=2 Tax=Halosaccharopolyspora lacisalsi TaxID=1000566 RepID=A0A839DXM1_9PSEU|nr:class A beta-lactamase [Halosaccharopolyspora lacisalsi]MBA8826244.1 beta-lactamase class A [Halosaccharopolyspora lacisalsi]